MYHCCGDVFEMRVAEKIRASTWSVTVTTGFHGFVALNGATLRPARVRSMRDARVTCAWGNSIQRGRERLGSDDSEWRRWRRKGNVGRTSSCIEAGRVATSALHDKCVSPRATKVRNAVWTLQRVASEKAMSSHGELAREGYSYPGWGWRFSYPSQSRNSIESFLAPCVAY